jgi:twitching motility protein PilT
MPRIDVYFRSIERFGATGAILSSGQSIMLRFPTGDRHATQVTAHDQLVLMVREVASPAVLVDIDRAKPARFEMDSQGHRYAISVVPRAGAWQVSIEPAAPSTPAAAAAPASARTQSKSGMSDMTIERGQYDPSPGAKATSGSAMLDKLVGAARTVRATDIYLATGAAAFVRVAGKLVASTERAPIDGDQLSRELGVVAPPSARAAWADRGCAVFAYGDGVGRIRVTLSRDQRGPGASLRLLPVEPPPLDRLGLGAEVDDWLDDRGLIVVAGPSGAGKTTTLASLVKALGDRQRRVVAFEDPIEIAHVSPWVSQRALGDHVTDVTAGVTSAMAEGADAIVISEVTTATAAHAVVEAVAGGHLVLTTLVAPLARVAVERMLDRLGSEQRELARALVADALLGTIGLSRGVGGQVAVEVVGRGRAS